MITKLKGGPKSPPFCISKVLCVTGSVEQKITEIIEPSITGMGFDLVRVQYQSGTLQIMAERVEVGTLTVEECADISNTVSALLDVADPIKAHYTLEVSSPGLDRPLVRLSDYERFSGYHAKVELSEPLDEMGRRKFKGLLKGANGTKVRMEVEGELVELPFAVIAQGKLEVTGDPLKRSPKKKLDNKSNSKTNRKTNSKRSAKS